MAIEWMQTKMTGQEALALVCPWQVGGMSLIGQQTPYHLDYLLPQRLPPRFRQCTTTRGRCDDHDPLLRQCGRRRAKCADRAGAGPVSGQRGRGHSKVLAWISRTLISKVYPLPHPMSNTACAKGSANAQSIVSHPRKTKRTPTKQC